MKLKKEDMRAIERKSEHGIWNFYYGLKVKRPLYDSVRTSVKTMDLFIVFIIGVLIIVSMLAIIF